MSKALINKCAFIVQTMNFDRAFFSLSNTDLRQREVKDFLVLFVVKVNVQYRLCK